MTIVNLQRITNTHQYGDKDFITAGHIYNLVLRTLKAK